MVGRASCFGASIDKLKNACESRYEHSFFLFFFLPCLSSTLRDIFGSSKVFCEKEGY